MRSHRLAPWLRCAAWRIGRIGWAILGLLFFLVWSVAGSAFVEFPPGWAMLWLLALGGSFFLFCVRPIDRGTPPRGGVDRLLRPPSPAMVRWLIVAIPVLLVSGVLLGLLESGFQATQAPSASGIGEYRAHYSWAWLPALTFVVLYAPLVEECAFRGWIQGSISRMVGNVVAVPAAGALFAWVHLQPNVFWERMAIGTALGWIVVTTGSLWASVLVHAGVNALGQMASSWLEGRFGSDQAFLTGVERSLGIGGLVVLLILSGAMLVWIGIRLWRERSKLAATKDLGPHHVSAWLLAERQ